MPRRRYRPSSLTNVETPPPTTSRLKRRDRLNMRWVWHLGGLNLTELARRIWYEVRKDDVAGRAAQLSYYFFLSLFPLLICATAIVGRVLGSDRALYEKLLESLSNVMPDSAFGIVRNTLNDIISRPGRGGISIGLVLALWTGSSGMLALIQGLNAAYDIHELRPWWRRRLVALGLTVVVLILGLSALLIVLLGGRAEYWLLTQIGMESLLGIWSVAQWFIVLLFMLIVFSLIYLLAPNLKERRWEAIMPGSLVALACWLTGSLLFKLYLIHFDSFSKTYGAVGAMIVLLLWLYLTSAAILTGAEVNSEIWNAAVAAGAKEAEAVRQEGA